MKYVLHNKKTQPRSGEFVRTYIIENTLRTDCCKWKDGSLYVIDNNSWTLDKFDGQADDISYQFPYRKIKLWERISILFLGLFIYVAIMFGANMMLDEYLTEDYVDELNDSVNKLKIKQHDYEKSRTRQDKTNQFIIDNYTCTKNDFL